MAKTERKPLISGNWKMHHNHFEALQLVQKLSYLLTGGGLRRRRRVGAPALHRPAHGADLLHEREGADPDRASAPSTATGRRRARSPARSRPAMLAKLDVAYVIAGHSERRELFGETDEDVHQKVTAILKAGMTPILCCGETLEEREAGATEAKVRGQVEAGLAGPEGRPGRRARDRLRADLGDRHRPHRHAEDAQAVCALVRAVVARAGSGDAAADAVRIQYGGSVKPTNAAELMAPARHRRRPGRRREPRGRGLRPHRAVPALSDSRGPDPRRPTSSRRSRPGTVRGATEGVGGCPFSVLRTRPGGLHVHLKRRSIKLLAVLLGLSLLAAACGGDDDDGVRRRATAHAEAATTAAGGEFVDFGTIVGDPLEHIDPALNTTLDGFQITSALYDGLTEIDFTDPDNPRAEGRRGRVVGAERRRHRVRVQDQGRPRSSPTARRCCPARSCGPGSGAPTRTSPVTTATSSTSSRAARRSSTATPRRITGIVADDEAMTLTTKLSAPYANWPTVAGFQLFYPMPEAVEAWPTRTTGRTALMVGNGPYKLDAPRTDRGDRPREERRVGRRPRTARPGTTASTRSRSSTQADPDTGYNAFEAGEADNAIVPPGRWGEAKDEPPEHDRPGPRHPLLRDQVGPTPSVGGPENVEAPPGDPPGDQPRGDQRGRLRRHQRAWPRRSSRRASPASRRTSASTAPTTRRPPRRASRSGRRPATS